MTTLLRIINNQCFKSYNYEEKITTHFINRKAEELFFLLITTINLSLNLKNNYRGGKNRLSTN